MLRLYVAYLVFCLFFLFSNLQATYSLSLSNSSSSGKQLCSPEERIALLNFKSSFQINGSAASGGNLCNDPGYPKTESWNGNIDCCLWDGVACDGLTGVVIGLDLSSAGLVGTIHNNSSLFLLHHLQKLNLSCNDFNRSEISSRFGVFSNLTCLDLHSSNLSGQLPSSLFHLTKLSTLRLSHNQISGHFPSYINGLPNLIHLDLSYNILTGKLPPWLFALPSLMMLHMAENSLTGPIEKFQQNNLMSIDLSENNLIGPVPDSLFDQVNLTNITLASNKLSGPIRTDMFSKLQNLVSLDFSYNSALSLTNSKDANFSLPILSDFNLSSCNITEFPWFLGAAKSLESVDLSHNSISGRVFLTGKESWQSLKFLDLSQNFITRFKINNSVLKWLDLHSNMIQGPLMDPPSTMISFSASENKMMGEIPSSFCNLSFITHLALFNNTLSGKIPQCIGNNKELRFLDLGMNKFEGSIPQTFSNNSELVIPNLNGNQLEGPLIRSLVNCTKLEVLDVGDNIINDTFPDWLVNLHQLQVLVLRSNKFHGTITNLQTRFEPFSKLRIVDFSHNEFSGLLPTTLLENLKAMVDINDSNIGVKYMYDGEYNYQLTTTIKGIDVQMERILTLFSTIDLSSNQFEGSIPKAIGNLNSLKVLNFSHNYLRGSIPSSLKNLTAVESLDLSSNNLTERIPTELTSLVWLSVLNVSYNHLVGPIPQGPQFNVFDNSSYVGNLGLCGLPLTKKCDNDKALEFAPSTLNVEEKHGTWKWFWIISMTGYGSGLVIGMTMAHMVFSTGRPIWIINMYKRLRQP